MRPVHDFADATGRPTESAETGRRRVLTSVEFDVLWEWLRLGATPVALRMDSPGHTTAARAGLVAMGWQALRESGLADSAGPDPELVRLFNLLARPTSQLELRMWRGHSLRAVAAGSRHTGVLAVRQDETVTLSGCVGLAAALVQVLPPLPAGTGRAVSVPTAALEAATGPTTSQPADPTATAGPAMALSRLLRGVPHRAQVAALAADRHNVLRRLPKILGVVDAAAGRYQLTRSTTAEGQEWTTLTPADPGRLRDSAATLLAEAHACARDPAAQPPHGP